MINKIREHRRELGLTQIELALATGIARHKIQMVEYGHAVLEPKDVSVLAKFFGYTDIPDFFSSIAAAKNGVEVG